MDVDAEEPLDPVSGCLGPLLSKRWACPQQLSKVRETLVLATIGEKAVMAHPHEAIVPWCTTLDMGLTPAAGCRWAVAFAKDPTDCGSGPNELWILQAKDVVPKCPLGAWRLRNTRFASCDWSWRRGAGIQWRGNRFHFSAHGAGACNAPHNDRRFVPFRMLGLDRNRV